MHHTEIGIFKIAQTRINWPEVFKWLKSIGVKNTDDIFLQLNTSDGTATDASALIALAGKRCYNSFEVGLNPNISKIRQDHAEYITNVLASGHGSVLEHATWTFAIENVSRVFTGEMNRHRAGVAVSEGSMRFIRFEDIGWSIPGSIDLTPEEDSLWEKICHDLGNSVRTDPNMTQFVEDSIDILDPEVREKALAICRKLKTRNLFDKAFDSMEKWQLDLTKIWKLEEIKDFTRKKQLTSMFRRIIGMGLSTGGVWTMNARAMRHILNMRASVHAEEEIYRVFDQIATIMVKDEPLLFGDFTKTEDGSWIPKYHKV